MSGAAGTGRGRWWILYRERVWWPAWVGGGARAWQGGVVAVLWPLGLWALGSALFWVAAHTVRVLVFAAGFGWLAVVCCAAAAVLPFVGGVMLFLALFRAATTPAERELALRRGLVGEGV